MLYLARTGTSSKDGKENKGTREHNHSRKGKRKADQQDELGPKKTKKGKKVLSKKKTKTDKISDSLEGSDDDAEPSKPITFYLFIESSTPPAAGMKKLRGKPDPALSLRTLQRAPFVLDSNTDFETFSRAIAKTTPCQIDAINVLKMQWRFETPLKGQRKLVTNNIGYNIMISAAKAKKGEAVIFIYMPPPPKPDIVSICATLSINLTFTTPDVAHW